MASLQAADNLILPKDAVPSTGGNTAAYETTYSELPKTGGKGKKSKKRVTKRRGTKKVSFVKWGKKLYRGIRKSISRK